MLFQRSTLRKPDPVYRQHEYTDDRMAELDRLIAAGLGDVRPVQHRSRTKYTKPKYAPHGSLKAQRLEETAARMREKNQTWIRIRIKKGRPAERPRKPDGRARTPRLCIEEGCGRKAETKAGICMMHHMRKRRANGNA